MKITLRSAITHVVSKVRAYYELETISLLKLFFSFGDVSEILVLVCKSTQET